MIPRSVLKPEKVKRFGKAYSTVSTYSTRRHYGNTETITKPLDDIERWLLNASYLNSKGNRDCGLSKMELQLTWRD